MIRDNRGNFDLSLNRDIMVKADRMRKCDWLSPIGN